MSHQRVKVFYWSMFGLSLVVLLQSFGVWLILMSLFIVPILILHLNIGLGLEVLKRHKSLIFASSLNLLAFTLIRPDGFHTITDTGLSKLFERFNISTNFSFEYDGYFLLGSIILFVVQVFVELELRNLKKVLYMEGTLTSKSSDSK